MIYTFKVNGYRKLQIFSYYYRLNGCYEHLDGGSIGEALQDFTGGVCETITIDKSKDYSIVFFQIVFDIIICFFEKTLNIWIIYLKP
jgi:hypothetical protein